MKYVVKEITNTPGNLHVRGSSPRLRINVFKVLKIYVKNGRTKDRR